MENSEESLGPRACHGFAARKLARYVSKLYERHMGAAQITNTQFSILVFLEAAGRLTTTGLTEAMAMDRTTLVRALKPLQSAGLIASASGSDTGRQLTFSLTPAGNRKFKEAVPLWAAAQQEYETQIGQEEARHLRHILQTITD
jgi:DNA-binding MarR family transcriptional regulator